MFYNCKRAVRENCQKRYGMHFSCRGNASGGRGNKISIKRTSEEINKRRKLERKLRREFPSGTYYFYQKKNIPLTFTCAYKRMYVENDKTTVFKIAFSDQDWYDWESSFDCHFWKAKKCSNMIDTITPKPHYLVPSTVTFGSFFPNDEGDKIFTKGENALMNIDMSSLSSIDFLPDAKDTPCEEELCFTFENDDKIEVSDPFLMTTIDQPLENNSKGNEIIETKSQKAKQKQMGLTLAAKNTSRITIESTIECDQISNEKTKQKKKKKKKNEK